MYPLILTHFTNFKIKENCLNSVVKPILPVKLVGDELDLKTC